jgi:D-alanine-D-alanine ligase
MKRVAVLRGGTGTEYDSSMLTGNAVLSALVDSVYPHRDIVITKNGDWLSAGKRLTPDQALEGIDVVFVALQGAFVEDSPILRILERKGIPYTGSRVLASGFAQNKELAKQTMRTAGVHTPKHRRIGQSEKQAIQSELEQIILDLGSELYIKPLRSRSPHTYRNVSEAKELEHNLVEMLDMYDDLLLEQKITGTAAQVGVLENYRGQSVYTFPASELEHDYIRPNRFPESIKNELARIAELAHTTIGCSQYSLIDFVVREGEVVFLKIDSHPELTATQNFAAAAESIGLSHQDLIYHLIETVSRK